VSLPTPARSGMARAAVTARALIARRPRRVETLVPAMSTAVRHELAAREFDIVHVAGSALAGISRELGKRPAVLAALDAWHLNVSASINVAPVLRRPLLRLEQRTVRRFGETAYRPFRRVVVVSEQDAEALRELDRTLTVEVVPNGVDGDYFAPDAAVAREDGLVVFTGAMGWAPNAEAAAFLAERVLPRLRAREPKARVAIVGRHPGPDVRALGRLDGVEVTGEVPDVRPWLHRASAFACPMVSGTGIKNKLLEALACGTPSVATPLSCQGIRVVADEQLLVAGSADDFATQLHRLLVDRGLRERLGAAARRAVVEAHVWDRVASSYERIYEQAIAHRPS
jgi:glycosyltransferase involved in cell wall biosynthesis